MLVAHHREDGYRQRCPAGLPRLMARFQDGANFDAPRESKTHHGFKGIEGEVVAKISAWMPAP